MPHSPSSMCPRIGPRSDGDSAASAEMLMFCPNQTEFLKHAHSLSHPATVMVFENLRLFRQFARIGLRAAIHRATWVSKRVVDHACSDHFVQFVQPAEGDAPRQSKSQ